MPHSTETFFWVSLRFHSAKNDTFKMKRKLRKICDEWKLFKKLTFLLFYCQMEQIPVNVFVWSWISIHLMLVIAVFLIHWDRSRLRDHMVWETGPNTFKLFTSITVWQKRPLISLSGTISLKGWEPLSYSLIIACNAQYQSFIFSRFLTIWHDCRYRKICVLFC